ncbi:GapR family DNA-binding domain-containing protein, partial [Paracoccus sulfuroxidans]
MRAADRKRRKAAPVKETAEEKQQGDNAYGVAAAELRQFIEQYEQLDAEKKDIADQQKELMGEAKA